MKNDTTPPKPVPQGWRLATLEEMKAGISGGFMCLLNRHDSWSIVCQDGDYIPAKHRNRYWYAVKASKPAVVYQRPSDRSAPKIPDSGTRTNFSTGAVRDAAPGKGLPSRVPPCALDSLEKRFEDGAAKYNDDEFGPNWMKGIPLSRFYDAIQRHSRKAAQGHDDEDHLGAVLWNTSAWLWTYAEIEAGRLPAELNDLPFHPHGIFARNRK